MTILLAVLLVSLIVFWFCFGGEWKETGTSEIHPSSEAQLGTTDEPRSYYPTLGFVKTASMNPLHTWDWRAEQIAPGVSRCPTDPENESA